MKRRAAAGLLWVSVAIAVGAFFLPWISIDMNRGFTGRLGELTQHVGLNDLAGRLSGKIGRVVLEVQQGSRVVAGELPDLSNIPSRVSGYEIPRVANRRDLQAVLLLSEMLTGESDVGSKSYLVYLLPVVAALLGALAFFLSGVPLVSGSVGLLALAVAGVGWWKLVTTPVDSLAVSVTIGPGLWLTLGAYVLLGLAAIVLGMTRPQESATISEP